MRIMKINKIQMAWISALVSVVLLNTTGCGGGKQETTETTTAVETNVQVEAASAAPEKNPADLIEAPDAFTDSTKQAEFEEVFDAAKYAFSPPQPGSLIRVKKTDGTVVVGELIRFRKDTIVVNGPEAPITISQSEITPESQAELFHSAFAEQIAKEQLEGTASDLIISEGEPAMIPPDNMNALEIRTMMGERFVPRAGPGRHFTEIPDHVLFRGVFLRVLEEKDQWICVKEDKDEAPVLGWIPKHASSVPMNESTRERIAGEVEAMKSDGFLVDINPQMNEARVDSFLWRTTDSITAEGKCRVLARYCGQQKNIRVYFVVVKDADSGKKVAEYSESRGFKVF